ncbi:hypothetical protein C0Q70_16206 [Pomacea canaliculata]|uniref:GT23 domain-containing protein n=1 Tax=Pomacea canaliculata TaxID=400727 RepID=A0A2T7NP65_POMCA|nr:hypothetical protein C0Q70_16206 [Pomacea canaliculata]
MIKKRSFFIAVSTIGIVILVITINYNWTLDRRRTWVLWTRNEPQLTNTETSIFELMDSCLQHKESLSTEELLKARQCLKRATTEITLMKVKQSETDEDFNQTKALYPLSTERETARRRVESTRERALLNDLHLLRHVDEDEEWRVTMSRQLGQLVQRRLYDLQNPHNCTTAKLSSATWTEKMASEHVARGDEVSVAGYAHTELVLTTNAGDSPEHLGPFMMPLSTCTANDTTDKFRAVHINRCGQVKVRWIHSHGTALDPKNQTVSSRVVQLKTLVGDWNNSPAKFRPRAIPADLAKNLRTFHGDPPTWWVGQLVSYLLRPQPHLQQTINAQVDRIGLQRPIVGIQVRRTDKVNKEAVLNSLEEYMKHVEEYYDLRQQHEDIKERRLFLATDEPSLFAELQKKYPHYNISRVEGSADTSSVKSRFTRGGLSAILVDLHLLSMCDFVVCTYSSNVRKPRVCVCDISEHSLHFTFHSHCHANVAFNPDFVSGMLSTSQVCRAVYELMQTRHGDASHKVYSLDSSVYYVTYYDIYYQRAVISHEARSAAEVSFQVGDLLHIHSYLYHLKERAVAGNLRNGSTFGMNSRTGKLGLFPSYKAVDEIMSLHEFPKSPGLVVSPFLVFVHVTQPVKAKLTDRVVSRSAQQAQYSGTAGADPCKCFSIQWFPSLRSTRLA